MSLTSTGGDGKSRRPPATPSRADLLAALASRDAALASRDVELAGRDAELDNLRGDLDARRKDLEAFQKENLILRAEIEILKRKIYGRSTEKLDPGQFELFQKLLEGDPGAHASVVEADSGEQLGGDEKRKKRGRKRRGVFPRDLARQELVIDVPDADKVCGECGCEKTRIGEDRMERIMPPAPPTLLVEVRPKYACPKCHEGVVQAPAPPHVVEKSFMTESFLAWLVTQKYAHHLPLYRIEQILARFKVDISRTALCEAVQRVAEALEPIVAHDKERLLATDYLNTDDTSIVVLKGRAPPIHKGRLWVYHCPLGPRPTVIYEASLTHHGAWPLKHLEGFTGYLQADAYSGYDGVYREIPGIVEVGCWAHARRKFKDAADLGDAGAQEILLHITELFGVEKQAREKDLSAMERHSLRQSLSAPLLGTIFEKALATSLTALPKSPMGKALTYALNQEAALRRFLEDGRLEIHNNAAERLLRNVAIGRKNYLFAGSERGLKTAATLYSLIQGCSLVGVDPQKYLEDVLIRVLSHPARLIDDLTPSRWAQLRAAAVSV